MRPSVGRRGIARHPVFRKLPQRCLMTRMLRRIVPHESAAIAPLPAASRGRQDTDSRTAKSVLPFPNRPATASQATNHAIDESLQKALRLLHEAVGDAPDTPTSPRPRVPKISDEEPAAMASPERPLKRTSGSVSQRSSRRVVLRLNRRIIRVLQGLASSGHRPNRFIESALQRDAVFRDAAAILGVQLPQLPSKH